MPLKEAPCAPLPPTKILSDIERITKDVLFVLFLKMYWGVVRNCDMVMPRQGNKQEKAIFMLMEKTRNYSEKFSFFSNHPE